MCSELVGSEKLENDVQKSSAVNSSEMVSVSGKHLSALDFYTIDPTPRPPYRASQTGRTVGLESIPANVSPGQCVREAGILASESVQPKMLMLRGSGLETRYRMLANNV